MGIAKILIHSVIVFHCCYDKIKQTYWFKTTQIYYLIVLEIRSHTRLNSRFGKTAFLLEVLGKNLFPCFFKLLGAHITWLMVPIFKASKFWSSPFHAAISLLLSASSLFYL